MTMPRNLGEILNDMEIVRNNLDFRTALPGLKNKVTEMTVAGSRDVIYYFFLSYFFLVK
jgi:hypothetical protein